MDSLVKRLKNNGKNNLLKKSIQLIILTLLVKSLGFVREMVLAAFYGTSSMVDIYVAVQNIPSVVFTVFGTAITTSFIPIYMEIKQESGKDSAKKFTCNVLNIFLIISIILTILGIVFSQVLVKIFAPGFQGEIFEICNNFTKITMASSVFIILVYVYNAYMQVNGRFNYTSLINIPYNIIQIIAIVLSVSLGNIYILAVGLLLASVSQAIYLRITVRNEGFHHQKILHIRDKHIWKMFLLVGPMFFSTGANQINSIVDKSLASTLVEGSISALNYSNEVVAIILQVLVLSITTIFYPTMAKLFSENNESKLNSFIQKNLSILALLIFPLAFSMYFFSEEIIRILFGRGAFQQQDIQFTASALRIFAIGVIGMAFRDILNKIFYSMKNTKVPAQNTIISVGLNIILNFLLIQHLAYLGLALATTISSIFCTILLFIQLSRKLIGLNIKNIMLNFTKIIIAAFFMLCSFFILDSLLKVSDPLIKCFVYFTLGSIIYIILLFLLKEEIVIEKIGNRRGKYETKR